MAVPTFTRYTQLPLRTEHRWDAEWTVQQALEDLKLGRFEEPALLADAILTDDRVRGVMDTRVNGMLGLGMDFEEEGDDDKDELSDAREQVLELARECREQMLPEEESAEFIAKAHLVGIQAGELVWDRGDQRLTPRLKAWDSQFLYWVWDPAKRPEQMFWLITAEGEVNLTPGDGHWVLYAPYGYYFGWRRGLLRNLSRLWLDRAYALRDWARRSERNGLGVTVGEVPQAANQKDKSTFINGLKRMASESTIIAPTGIGPNADQKFGVSMVDTKEGEISQFYAEHFRQIDTSIAVCVLGQNLTTDISRGGSSRAAAQVHENVRRDFLRYDAMSWSRFVEEQVFKPWAEVNFGSRELAPRPKIDVDPPEDLKNTADGLASLGQALAAFQQAGAPVDQRKLLDQQGVPVTDEEREPAPPAKPDEKPAEKPAALRLTSSTARRRTGSRKARRYLDDLAVRARELAAKAVRSDIERLMKAVKDATTLEEVRHRVLAAYHGLSPSQLEQLVEKAMTLSHLAGRAAVIEDL